MAGDEVELRDEVVWLNGAEQPRVAVEEGYEFWNRDPHLGYWRRERGRRYLEELDGRRAIVHRHNSARAYPASRMPEHPVFGRFGQALLLPGTSRTSSYLCVAGEGARASLYSASHGAGSTIDRFAADSLSGLDPEGRRTLRFRYSAAAPVEVRQLDDRGVDDTLDVLARHDVVRPVARLRPWVRSLSPM